MSPPRGLGGDWTRLTELLRVLHKESVCELAFILSSFNSKPASCESLVRWGCDSLPATWNCECPLNDNIVRFLLLLLNISWHWLLLAWLQLIKWVGSVYLKLQILVRTLRCWASFCWNAEGKAFQESFVFPFYLTSNWCKFQVETLQYNYSVPHPCPLGNLSFW